jgi:hypothetical protein
MHQVRGCGAWWPYKSERVALGRFGLVGHRGGALVGWLGQWRGCEGSRGCLGRLGTEGRAAAQYFGVDKKILHGSPSKH